MNTSRRPWTRVVRSASVLGLLAAGLAIPTAAANAGPCRIPGRFQDCVIAVERPHLPVDPGCPACTVSFDRSWVEVINPAVFQRERIADVQVNVNRIGLGGI